MRELSDLEVHLLHRFFMSATLGFCVRRGYRLKEELDLTDSATRE